MIKLNKNSKISTIKNQKKSVISQPKQGSFIRPEVVNAKVYKVKSAFVKNSVFITLSYIDTDSDRRPIEIFINSKDLNRSAEYVVLTRLISAIFRRATDPMFILEELHGIHDPNGGSFKNGKYFHSFYAEVAHVIEQFFYDVNIIDKPAEELLQQTKEVELNNDLTNEANSEKIIESIENNIENAAFKICPDCQNKSLKTENGCDSCVTCGYSKGDK